MKVKALINDPFEIVAAVEESKFDHLNVNNIKQKKRLNYCNH